jgi:uncharacterized protein (DUF302 family)
MLKTLISLTVLILSFNSFSGSPSSKNPMPILTEGEYGVDTDNNDNQWSGKADGDLDVYIDRNSSLQPIEFSIEIPVNPENQTATLVMDIWDVDAHCDSPKEGCEVDEVFVNDIKVGVLNGKNDEWSKNRFMIPENVLKQGFNQIKIDINTLEVQNWAVELNWAYITGLSIDPNKLSISRCWVAPQEVRPGEYVNFFAKVRGNPDSVNVYNGDLKVLDITDPDGDGVYSGQFQTPSYWADSDNQNWKSNWIWQASKEGQESVCPGFKLRQDVVIGSKVNNKNTVIKIPVSKGLSTNDVEEAMEETAMKLNIRSVGMLPLSEMVELQTGAKKKFYKIYQYVSPRKAMSLIEYNRTELSIMFPIRIHLVEDADGNFWLTTPEIDLMVEDQNTMPENIRESLSNIKIWVKEIMNAGATGDF